MTDMHSGENKINPALYEQPLDGVVEAIPTFEAAAQDAEEELIRQQSLALGMAVHQLALHYNGLASPDSNMQNLRNTAALLMGKLGIRNILLTAQPKPDTRQRIFELSASIQAKMADESLSLRTVANQAGCAHTTIAAVKNGEASLSATIQVAKALGLIPEQDGVDE